VQLFFVEWLLAAVSAAEADVVASLHRLAEESVGAFVRCDVRWLQGCLGDDFVCTLADGRRLDKARLVTLSAKRVSDGNLTCDDVDVRPIGQLGLVHGVAHSGDGDSQTSTRFTQVWLIRDGRWQLIAAQLTRVAANASSRVI
jgi:Domain of unknown function (DUF4440)